MKIKNGKDTALNANSGTLPQLDDGLRGWFQKLSFKILVKTVENFEVNESITDVSFIGTWQPMSASQLFYKPEGQRSWKWYVCHSTTQLPLKNDDKVTFLSKNYRVKALNEASLYGVFEYHLVEDYEGS